MPKTVENSANKKAQAVLLSELRAGRGFGAASEGVRPELFNYGYSQSQLLSRE